MFDEWFSKSSEDPLDWMFDVRSFEAKIKVFEFNYQYVNTFEFVWWSKNDVPVWSMFDEMVFDHH